MISRVFFLAVLPMVLSVLIHSLISSGSVGGFGISTNSPVGVLGDGFYGFSNDVVC
jgi:hypothetical protein